MRDYDHANELLQKEIDYYHQNHQHSTTSLTPNAAWEKARAEGRSQLKILPAAKLLNLPFALPVRRRVRSAQTVEFLGRLWKITPTARQNVLHVHHPEKHFWVTAPAKHIKTWPDI